MWSRDDAETPDILASLRYQDLLPTPIKGHLFVCSMVSNHVSFPCFMPHPTLMKFVAMDNARYALSSIQDLSGDDSDIPISETQLESAFTLQKSILSGTREDWESPPFPLVQMQVLFRVLHHQTASMFRDQIK